MARKFTPLAAYSELKRVESFIEQAQTVEDLRRIAATGTGIGFKALYLLIAGKMTAAEMKPDEARLALEQEPVFENSSDAFKMVLEQLLLMADFFPSGKRLYGYQIDGIRFLSQNEGALLGDDMGLGKTIQAIGAMKILYRLQRIKHALILCPWQLISQWERDIEAWAPELFVRKIRGNQQKRAQSWRSGATVHITNYDTWRNDLESIPALARRYDLVILDEAQTVKQPNSAVTRTVGQIKATYRWGLSGTPLENRIDDVVTIYNFLQPELFRRTQAPYQSDMVKRLIKPFFLRRRLADVQPNLPSKIPKEIWLDLSDEQRQSYEQIEEQSRQSLNQPGIKPIHILAEISKLKQICSYDHLTGESCKLEFLFEELEKIAANGQKALVFSQFPQIVLRPIQKKLQMFDAEVYDGSLSDKQGKQIIDAFQHNDSPKVLLTSVKSGGTGLNLTKASHVFHFDHWWNPAIARQAEARAHRIGQEMTVVVYSLFTSETIEEKIHKILKVKEGLFKDVIDGLTEEEIIGSLSSAELYGLFGLEPPKPKGKRGTKPYTYYQPSAEYSDLKRIEKQLNEAQTIEEMRQIAREAGTVIGPKAFCYLLGELTTPEAMKGLVKN